MQKADGMNYAPVTQFETEKVVKPGQFNYAAIGLSHGHIYAMCNGLNEAGATLKYVYEEDSELLEAFLKFYPETEVAKSEEQILLDSDISLVASAAIPNERTPLGIRVLKSGKHYFADKPAMTTFEQLEEAKKAVSETRLKYYIYYGEMLHVESAVYAQQMIDEGKVGRVLQIIIMAPHRMNKESRPDWFFNPEQSGEILTDLGSHQFEQFLSYTGAKTASVLHSKTANYANKDHSAFRDFADATLLADNGATGYCRVDWFTPDGLGAWGDGRVFVMGTKGTIEIRKYLDVANVNEGDHVIYVNNEGEFRYDVFGKVGYPFFGEFILDCINGTEHSMTQDRVFEAMRIALEASSKAIVIE
ncbi:MAG: Gfo/Idh/MocA family protein [Christensenellales bacterium]|jgi:predicted dehydrogenase